jgi:hypothetical protein
LKHLKKFVKKFAILIYPPKNLLHKRCIISQKIQQKKIF